MKKIKLFVVLSLFTLNTVIAQNNDTKITDKKKDEKSKTLEDFIKSSKKIEGLFDIYQDTITGQVQMLIREDQLNKDYIYGSQIADGVVRTAGFRGQYKDEKILNFKKFFNKIEISAVNSNFYFDENNPLSKSKDANISNSLISSIKIKYFDKKKNAYLIDADGLFISELLTRIKLPTNPFQYNRSFQLGRFDRGKSKIEKIKNYPKNLNVKTNYVYNNPNVGSSGSNAVEDSRYVSIKTFHTIVEMPDDDYQIRLDDQRVGYFLTQVDNLTDPGTTNYRDLINRWKLIKKDPSLEISEPVKPITWWIENSTPIEWRETIKEAVLQWNPAFEKAGFKNAIQVKIQPDDAEWDAGDIRYNVLRWTSSPNPPFGGYGPSMVNPRTGEIIAADIMLEFVFFTNRVFYDKLYSDATSIMDTNNYDHTHDHDNFVCSAGSILHDNINFGRTFIALNGDDYDLEELERQSMMYLIMHEVGHTLGLNHNMKSSSIHSISELYDANELKGKAISGSVMDYPALNLNPNPKIKSPYADSSVGHYDKWAIEFGYKPFNSEQERNEILSRSTDPLLIFGNDADILYSSRGIDPRVQTNDMSSDPISYSIDRMRLVNELFDDILDKFQISGNTYEDLRRAFFNLNSQYAGAASTISKFIGGVYVERSVIGQKGSKKPYTPVNYKDQKRAFKALDEYIFSSDNYKIPSKIINYLARQRRGFEFYSGPEDPKIHDLILSNQARILSQLMAPNTLQRLKDSELYGNKYKLSEFMTDLYKSIFSEIDGNIDSFRQNLQIVYTKRLIDIISSDKGKRYKNHAKSLALLNLNEIMESINSNGNISSRAHKMHLKSIIEKALDND